MGFFFLKMSMLSGQFKNEKEILTQEIGRVYYNFLEYLIKLSVKLVKGIDDLCFIEQIKLLKVSEKQVIYIDFF